MIIDREIEKEFTNHDERMKHTVANGIAVVGGKDLLHIGQDGEFCSIDKHQAAQLIAVLQKWVDGGEVE